MARQQNAMITFNDAQYMVANLGFNFKNIGCPSTNECMTKGDIDFYLVTDPSYYTSYSSNQLVPYQKVNRGLYVLPQSPHNIGFTANSFEITIEASSSWTISDNAGWLTLSETSGVGDGTVTATYTQNPSGSTRAANITISTPTQTFVLELTQSANPGTDVSLITIGFDSSDAFGACADYPNSIVYLEDGTSMFAGQLYSDSAGINFAPSGWYSNGTLRRFWNISGTWSGGTENCL